MTESVPISGKLRTLERPVLRQRLRLPPEREALLDDWQVPATLLGRLAEAGLLPEATRLLAYALPERESVWWACMCVAHTMPAAQPEPEGRALAAAEAWVRRPDDGARREAAWAAAAAGYEAPGAWAALAAYWSRRSLPLDTRGGRGVETAVARAAVRGGAEHQAERLLLFIGGGTEIAGGGVGRLPTSLG
jgi:hypothetical protein